MRIIVSGTRKRGISIELGFMLKSIWFPVGIVLTIVLCMMSAVYFTEKELSVIQVLIEMKNGSSSLEWEQLDMQVILNRIPNGYLALFTPVAAALPCILSFHAEKVNRFKRFYMFRCGSAMQYHVRKWLAGMVAGGMVLAFGVALFQILLMSFSGLFLHRPDGRTITVQADIVFYLQYYVGIFLYGAMSSVPAILICFFSDNFYFIVCVPFLMTYLYDVAIVGVRSFLEEHWEENVKLLDIIGDMSSASYVYILEEPAAAGILLLRILAVVLIVFLCLQLYGKYQTDCGG